MLNPNVYTRRRLVVFVHVVYGKPDELAVYNGGRIVERISGRLHVVRSNTCLEGFVCVKICQSKQTFLILRPHLKEYG